MSLSLKLTALAGIALSGGNIYDLVGRKLWFVFNDASLVGVGATLLLAVLVLLRRKQIC
jgi:hypothetical protein